MTVKFAFACIDEPESEMQFAVKIRLVARHQGRFLAITAFLKRAFCYRKRAKAATQEWCLVEGVVPRSWETSSPYTAPKYTEPARHFHTAGARDGLLRRLIREEFSYGHAFLFVPVLLGFGSAIWFWLDHEPAAAIVWSAPFFLLSAFILWRSGKQKAALGALVPGLLAGGMLSAQMESARLDTVILDGPVTTTVTGVIERREAVGDQRWRYIVRLTDTAQPKLKRAPKQVTLVARGRGSALETNSIIRGRVRLSPPSGPALPGLSDFSFGAYFDATGATGFLYGNPQLIGVEDTNGLKERLVLAAYALRSYVGDRIRQLIPGDEGAFAAAIVTDERRAISPEVVDALRLSGLAHIVAISGLNMALAAGIFFVGLRSVLVLIPGVAARLPVKKIAAFSALLMVTAYYGISGFGVSAERAYIMMAVLLLAILFNRPSLSMRNIALAALIIIILRPSSVMGASFQMSFAATAALLACYRLWADRGQEGANHAAGRANLLTFATRFSQLLVGTLLTSAIGGLATAVFSIAHFNQLTAYGLAANLATMPIISLIVMPFGLMGMLMMPFGLDEPFFTVMAFGLRFVIAVAVEVASWGGNVQTGRAAEWLLPLSTIGLILFVLLRTHIRWLGLLILVLAIAANATFEQPRPDIVIAEDGRLVALLNGDKASVSLPKPSEFIFKQWRNGLGIDEVIPPFPVKLDASGNPASPSLNGVNGGSGEPASQKAPRAALTSIEIAGLDQALQKSTMQRTNTGHFHCVKGALCIASIASGVTVAVVADTRLTGYACDKSSLVIVSGSPFAQCRSGALLLTANKLRQTGVVEIRFNNQTDPKAWNLRSAFSQTDRPWQIQRAYNWRTDSFTPFQDDIIKQIRIQ